MWGVKHQKCGQTNKISGVKYHEKGVKQQHAGNSTSNISVNRVIKSTKQTCIDLTFINVANQPVEASLTQEFQSSQLNAYHGKWLVMLSRIIHVSGSIICLG